MGKVNMNLNLTMMKYLIILIICLKFAFGYDCTEPKTYVINSESCPGLKRLMDLTHEADQIKYTVSRYDAMPCMKWIDYAKKLISRKESPLLNGITNNDVDEALNENTLGSISNITLYTIDFEVRGPELFTHGNSEWAVYADDERYDVKPGKSHNMESTNPILKSLTDDISIEFLLGYKFSNAEAVDIMDGSKKESPRTYSLSDPELNFMLEGSDQRMNYHIFMHGCEVYDKSLADASRGEQKLANKIFKILRGIAENFVKKIKSLQPELHLELPYSYSSKSSAIGFNDDNLYEFVRRWATGLDSKHVKVDIYTALKYFLKNPDIWRKFYFNFNVPHSPHEIEVEGKIKNIFIGDKLAGKKGVFGWGNDLSGFPVNPYMKPRNAAGQNLHNRVNKRIEEILHRVENQGIDIDHIGDLHTWIKHLMKQDFQKHREQNDEHGHRFVPIDEHLSADLRVNFQTDLMNDEEIKQKEKRSTGKTKHRYGTFRQRRAAKDGGKDSEAVDDNEVDNDSKLLQKRGDAPTKKIIKTVVIETIEGKKEDQGEEKKDYQGEKKKGDEGEEKKDDQGEKKKGDHGEEEDSKRHQKRRAGVTKKIKNVKISLTSKGKNKDQDEENEDDESEEKKGDQGEEEDSKSREEVTEKTKVVKVSETTDEKKEDKDEENEDDQSEKKKGDQGEEDSKLLQKLREELIEKIKKADENKTSKRKRGDQGEEKKEDQSEEKNEDKGGKKEEDQGEEKDSKSREKVTEKTKVVKVSETTDEKKEDQGKENEDDQSGEKKGDQSEKDNKLLQKLREVLTEKIKKAKENKTSKGKKGDEPEEKEDDQGEEKKDDKGGEKKGDQGEQDIKLLQKLRDVLTEKINKAKENKISKGKEGDQSEEKKEDQGEEKKEDQGKEEGIKLLQKLRDVLTEKINKAKENKISKGKEGDESEEMKEDQGEEEDITLLQKLRDMLTEKINKAKEKNSIKGKEGDQGEEAFVLEKQDKKNDTCVENEKPIKDHCKVKCGEDPRVTCTGTQDSDKNTICACRDKKKVYLNEFKVCIDRCRIKCGEDPGVTCTGIQDCFEHTICTCRDANKVYLNESKECKDRCGIKCGGHPSVTCTGIQDCFEHTICTCRDANKVYMKEFKECKDYVRIKHPAPRWPWKIIMYHCRGCVRGKPQKAPYISDNSKTRNPAPRWPCRQRNYHGKGCFIGRPQKPSYSSGCRRNCF